MSLECSGYVDPASDGKTAKATMKCHFQLPEPACQNHIGVSCPPDLTDGLYVFMGGGFANYDPPCPPVWSATWDWGDGTVDEFFQLPDGYVYPFPNDHTYAEQGSYTVDIRLFDEEGYQLDQTQCLVSVE